MEAAWADRQQATGKRPRLYALRMQETARKKNPPELAYGGSQSVASLWRRASICHKCGLRRPAVITITRDWWSHMSRLFSPFSRHFGTKGRTGVCGKGQVKGMFMFVLEFTFSPRPGASKCLERRGDAASTGVVRVSSRSGWCVTWRRARTDTITIIIIHGTGNGGASGRTPDSIYLEGWRASGRIRDSRWPLGVSCWWRTAG